MRTGTHDVCLTRLSRNWAKRGEFDIDLREGPGRKRAAVAHPNAGSWRVRRTQAGCFGGPLELRFRDRGLWRGGGRRRVWSEASLLKPRIKEARDRKEDFFSSSKEKKKMDLFEWLLGCLLTFLWSSSVRGEEGGKFDVFLPPEVLTVNRLL